MTATVVLPDLDEQTIAELQPPCEDFLCPDRPAEYAVRGSCTECGRAPLWLLCGVSLAQIRAVVAAGQAVHYPVPVVCGGQLSITSITRIGGNG